MMDEHSAQNDGRAFRWIVGLLCVLGSLAAFAGLYFIEIPKSNEQALLLALGYLFGWGSAVVQSEYGATSTGRKAAESAIRGLERQAEQPAGTDSDPMRAKIVNPKDEPANVQEQPSD